MRVDGVKQLNYSKVTQQNFKGLWEPAVYERSQLLYGEVDCDYYEKTYHPWADETDSQIKKALREMDEINTYDGVSFTTTYTTLKVGKRLSMTTKMYEDILAGKMNEKFTFLEDA